MRDVAIAPRYILLAVAALAAGSAAADEPGPGAKMQEYRTRYYVIHTDLDIDAVREAAVRMTSMAEEYHQRTKAFAGAITAPLPFFLYSHTEDYLKGGGIKGSAGLFRGQSLMADASYGPALWHIVQHEGFHQFAYYVIAPNLPVWVNEGLAEYFGEGRWTGDNMVTGLIPPGRLARVRKHIEQKEFKPFSEILGMDIKTWNGNLAINNYDEAWSMVHFLVHGENGKYAQLFAGYLNDVRRVGSSSSRLFTARFGDGPDFQRAYEAWWTDLPKNPTEELYAESTVRILTSYLARARILNLKFTDANSFFGAAGEGKIAIDGARQPRLWLPPSLLKQALGEAAGAGQWSLQGPAGNPKLILDANGTILTGTFVLQEERSPRINVTMGKPPEPAKAAGK